MRRTAWIAGLAFLGACQSSSSDFHLGPTDANVAGQFTLVSINSTPLPVQAVLTTTESWAITSDTLTITPDGQWSETTVYIVTQLSDETTSTRTTNSGGTYSIANQTIDFVLTSGGAATFTGSVQGSTLTLLYNGGHFFYVRT